MDYKYFNYNEKTTSKDDNHYESLEECCVCLEFLDKNREIVVLECSHQLHLQCYIRWKSSKKPYSNHCPICLHKNVEIVNILNTVDVSADVVIDESQQTIRNKKYRKNRKNRRNRNRNNLVTTYPTEIINIDTVQQSVPLELSRGSNDECCSDNDECCCTIS